MTHRLIVKPYGTVRGGFLDYSVLGDTLSYNGELTVKVLFSTRTVPFSGTLTQHGAWKNSFYAGNPTPWTKVGQVAVQVVHITADTTDVAVAYPPDKLTGQVAIESGAPDADIVIAGVRLKAEIHGVTLNIVAAPSIMHSALAV
jgi:hypothetical protein